MMSSGHSCTSCPLRERGVCGALDLQSGAIPIQYSMTKTRTVMIRRDAPAQAVMLCSGLAIQYVQLHDGRRQILTLRRPGDLLLGTTTLAEKAFCSVQAVGNVTFATIDKNALLGRIAADPSLLTMFGRMCFDEKVEFSSLMIDMGRRDGPERVAHLIVRSITSCRAKLVDNRCTLPMVIRQEDIADIVGLTPTHVNRILTNLRREGLIEMTPENLTVLDYNRLASRIA